MCFTNFTTPAYKTRRVDFCQNNAPHKTNLAGAPARIRFQLKEMVGPAGFKPTTRGL